MFPCIEALFLPGLRGYVTALTGRALDWQSRGQRFDPANLHQNNIIRTFCRLVMGSDLLFLWKKLKTGNEKSGRTADRGNPPAFVM